MDWMESKQTFGRTVTLKVKFHDFKQITRSKTHHDFIDQLGVLQEIADHLISGVDDPRPVRLIGLGISNLNNQQDTPGDSQLNLNL